MARARADAAVSKSKVFAPAPASNARAKGSPTSRSASTGIAGGSGIAALAQLLPPPYKMILSIIAPTLSVVIAAWGPKILDLVALGIEHFATGWRRWYILHRHRVYMKSQRKKLKNKDLAPERRRIIEASIKRAEASIDNHEYEWVSPYLRGDTTSGIRSEPSPKGEVDVNAVTPADEGEGR